MSTPQDATLDESPARAGRRVSARPGWEKAAVPQFDCVGVTFSCWVVSDPGHPALAGTPPEARRPGQCYVWASPNLRVQVWRSGIWWRSTLDGAPLAGPHSNPGMALAAAVAEARKRDKERRAA